MNTNNTTVSLKRQRSSSTCLAASPPLSSLSAPLHSPSEFLLCADTSFGGCGSSHSLSMFSIQLQHVHFLLPGGASTLLCNDCLTNLPPSPMLDPMVEAANHEYVWKLIRTRQIAPVIPSKLSRPSKCSIPLQLSSDDAPPSTPPPSSSPTRKRSRGSSIVAAATSSSPQLSIVKITISLPPSIVPSPPRRIVMQPARFSANAKWVHNAKQAVAVCARVS